MKISHIDDTNFVKWTKKAMFQNLFRGYRDMSGTDSKRPLVLVAFNEYKNTYNYEK